MGAIVSKCFLVYKPAGSRNIAGCKEWTFQNIPPETPKREPCRFCCVPFGGLFKELQGGSKLFRKPLF